MIVFFGLEAIRPVVGDDAWGALEDVRLSHPLFRKEELSMFGNVFRCRIGDIVVYCVNLTIFIRHADTVSTMFASRGYVNSQPLGTGDFGGREMECTGGFACDGNDVTSGLNKRFALMPDVETYSGMDPGPVRVFCWLDWHEGKKRSSESQPNF